MMSVLKMVEVDIIEFNLIIVVKKSFIIGATI